VYLVKKHYATAITQWAYPGGHLDHGLRNILFP